MRPTEYAACTSVSGNGSNLSCGARSTSVSRVSSAMTSALAADSCAFRSAPSTPCGARKRRFSPSTQSCTPMRRTWSISSAALTTHPLRCPLGVESRVSATVLSFSANSPITGFSNSSRSVAVADTSRLICSTTLVAVTESPPSWKKLSRGPTRGRPRAAAQIRKTRSTCSSPVPGSSGRAAGAEK